MRALARGWGWQVRKRVLRRPVDVAYEGYVLRCHPDSQSASNVWYFTARYDHDEMDFLDRYLRPGDRVIDIGANIGTYVLFAARRIGPDGRITALEPEPRNATRLQENIDLNALGSLVEVHAVAVASETGEVEFTLDHDVSNAIVLTGAARGTRTVVPAVRLDEVVEAHERLAVAKMDVEGAEAMAMRGAEALLAERLPPVWITEILENQLQKLGSSAAEAKSSSCVTGSNRSRGLLRQPNCGRPRGTCVATSSSLRRNSWRKFGTAWRTPICHDVSVRQGHSRVLPP
jgi:FkbM family methyltransferase